MNVDVTAYYKGYHADLNETYGVGQIDEESKKLIKCAHDVSHEHRNVHYDDGLLEKACLRRENKSALALLVHSYD